MNNSNIESKRNISWNFIYNKFKQEVENLNASYDHQGLKGEENERVFINFLNSFLPRRFKIEQRKVLLDWDGKESKEQDIVIWDSILGIRKESG